MKKILKFEIVNQFKKSKMHLDYSLQKVKKINLNIASDQKLKEEELETLESIAARFSRTSDIIIQKYFRILATEKDPAYKYLLIFCYFQSRLQNCHLIPDHHHLN